MIIRAIRKAIELYRYGRWKGQLPFKLEIENKERIKYIDDIVVAYIWCIIGHGDDGRLILNIDLGFVSAYAPNDLINEIPLTAEQRKLIKERLILVYEKRGIPVYFEGDEPENENDATNGQISPPLPD